MGHRRQVYCLSKLDLRYENGNELDPSEDAQVDATCIYWSLAETYDTADICIGFAGTVILRCAL
jgi:hypothetical protein